MPKLKGARRFLVFTQPHMGDPQWLTPVVELQDNPDPTKPATPIEYTDMTVLEQTVLQLSRDRARAAGFNAGAQEILTTFGISQKEYFERKKSQKEKEACNLTTSNTAKTDATSPNNLKAADSQPTTTSKENSPSGGDIPDKK